MQTSTPDQIRATVRQVYGMIATEKPKGGCCGGGTSCCGPTGSSSSRLGYSDADLAAVPDGADLGLGCGNPQAIAGLAPGETQWWPRSRGEPCVPHPESDDRAGQARVVCDLSVTSRGLGKGLSRASHAPTLRSDHNARMKIIRAIVVIVALSTVALATSACPEKGPAEKAGEKVDKAVDKTKDAAKDLKK